MGHGPEPFNLQCLVEELKLDSLLVVFRVETHGGTFQVVESYWIMLMDP